MGANSSRQQIEEHPSATATSPHSTEDSIVVEGSQEDSAQQQSIQTSKAPIQRTRKAMVTSKDAQVDSKFTSSATPNTEPQTYAVSMESNDEMQSSRAKGSRRQEGSHKQHESQGRLRKESIETSTQGGAINQTAQTQCQFNVKKQSDAPFEDASLINYQSEILSPFEFALPGEAGASPYQWHVWPYGKLSQESKTFANNSDSDLLEPSERQDATSFPSDYFLGNSNHKVPSNEVNDSTTHIISSYSKQLDKASSERSDSQLEQLADEIVSEFLFCDKSPGPMQVNFPEWYASRLSPHDQILRENSVESLTGLELTEGLVPCVFNWTHGGHTVYLTGSFSNWSAAEKIRMIRSGHEFSVIKELPRTVHFYKFIAFSLGSAVDEQWRFAPNQPTHTDENGNVNNILDLSNYHFYNFTVPKDHEQARQANYHQFVPGSNDYTTDAPVIPILLSKSNCVAAEPPLRISAPLHALANHLYHDSHAAHLFGPHIISVTSTQRWRHSHKSPLSTAGLRFSTLTYITFNPLFPCHGDPGFELHAASPLRTLLAQRRREDIVDASAGSESTKDGNKLPKTCPYGQKISVDSHSGHDLGATDTISKVKDNV